MSDIDLAVKKAKHLERLLERDFGADGRGLHEMVSSIEGRLPPELVKRLRFIATVRNRLVHEADVKRINDRRGFKQACVLAEQQLEALAGRTGNPYVLAAIVVGVFVALFVGAFLLVKWKLYAPAIRGG